MSDLDIRFPPMGSIRARVIDRETGLLVEKFTVSLRATENCDDEGRPRGSACTEGVHLGGPIPEAEFHLLDLLPCQYGTWCLEIRSDEYCCREFDDVPVARNQTTDLGKIPLYRNWWVRGRVIATETGRPVAAGIEGPPGITVTTDAEGRFELTMTPEHESCDVKVIPLDKVWQDAFIEVERPGQPVADVGDILLKRTPSESPQAHPE